MNRLQRSWHLMKSSWQVVRADRELLALPVFSALASLMVLATFAAPGWLSLERVTTTSSFDGSTSTSLEPTVLTYVVGAGFYLVSAFVVIFFNAALIHGANERFNGGDPTLGSALAGAWQRVGLIFQWAVVSATVSMVIRQIQERGGLLGRLVGGLIGFAWAVVTFLVLPTLVIEGVGVRDAFRKSAESIKSTWGENVIGQGGFGILGFFAVLPGILGVTAGLVLMGSSTALGVAVLAVSAIGLMVATVVLTAMSVVYQTALYRYAAHLEVPAYQSETLGAAFAPRRSRLR